MTALVMASLANMFAAIKGAENGKLMKTEGLKDRIGGVGNQFAMTEVLGFLISLPVRDSERNSESERACSKCV
eukprot:5094819-Pleurochrysis_carterae.AAC.1